MRLSCRSAMFVLPLLACGCGTPLVDPGRATRIPPPMQQPVPQPQENSSGLPTLQMPEFQQVPADSVFQMPDESNSATYHTVQSGETLSSISKRYGISSEKLRAANGLDASAKLKSQQLLFIPKQP